MVHVNRVVITMLGDASQFNRMADQVIGKTMQMAHSFGMLGSTVSKMFGAGATGAAMGGFLGAITGIVVGGTLGLFSAGIGLVTGSISRLAEMGQSGAEHIFNLGTHIAETGMKFEMFRADFETMTGSLQKGLVLFQEIKDLTIRTPYTFEQLSRGTQLLLGMGVPAEEVTTVLTKLGDIAGGNVIRLQRLALAYGQVVSAGRFMGQELRQFAESGVGAADFGTANNMSGSQLRDMMREGRVTVGMMINGINSVTGPGGRFFGRNERIFDTVYGQWIALKERLEIAFADLAENIFKRFQIAGKLSGLREIFTNMLGGLNPYIDKVASWFERSQGSMEKVLEIVGTIGVGFYRIMMELEPFVPTWKEVEKILTNINDNTLPILAEGFRSLLITILDIGDHMVSVYTFIGKQLFGASVGASGGAIGGLFGPIGAVIGSAKGSTAGNEIASAIDETWESAFGEGLGESSTRLQQRMNQVRVKLENADWFEGIQSSGREWNRLARSLGMTSNTLNANAAIIGGLGAVAAEAMKKIQVPIEEMKISGEAQKMAADLLKNGFTETSPFEKLKEGMKLMDEAFWGPMGIGKYSANGPVPTGPLAGRRDLFDLGNVMAFENARKMLGPDPESIWKKMETNLPKAITKGSKDAIDTMQRSVAAARRELPIDERQKAMRDLQRIREAHEKSKEKLGIIADVLKEMRDKGGLEGLGF